MQSIAPALIAVFEFSPAAIDNIADYIGQLYNQHRWQLTYGRLVACIFTPINQGYGLTDHSSLR